MPSLVTVTTPALDEIVVSSSYLQGVGEVERLGASQIEHTSARNSNQKLGIYTLMFFRRLGCYTDF